MSTSINQNFTARTLLTFAMPSIIMMVFMSFYTIVDGIFVSRFVGSNALSSLNIVYPAINILIAIASMLATGGTAIISKYLGQNKKREANEILLADYRRYLKILMLFAPMCMLQTLFQSYLITAGKPALGLILTIGAGILNGILDYIFIVPLNMGIGGAAFATGIGQSIPAIAGCLFFFFSKKDLHFTRFTFHPKAVALACYNGSSEMIGQMSGAVITFLFNITLIRLVGEHGVAAVSILLYGQFLFNAFYMGFSIGISPIIGFQYGACNKERLKNVYKISILFVIVSSVILMMISILAATPIVSVFTEDKATFELAASGFKIFAVAFLFSGINITSSGIFTALSNGTISAIISFARTLVFTAICLLTLPPVLGITGVWIAVPAAEFLTTLLCIVMHMRYFVLPGKRNYIR